MSSILHKQNQTEQKPIVIETEYTDCAAITETITDKEIALRNLILMDGFDDRILKANFGYTNESIKTLRTYAKEARR